VDRLRLTDFDSDLLLAFLEHLEGVRHNRISTRNCRLAALHSFFAHALRLHPEHSGQLARILALPSKRHLPAPPRYLDPPVIQTLLRHPDRQTSSGRRDFALLLFLYNTGARVSEAASLRGKDLLPGPQFHSMVKAARIGFPRCGQRRSLRSKDSSRIKRLGLSNRCSAMLAAIHCPAMASTIFSVSTLLPSINRIHLFPPRSGSSAPPFMCCRPTAGWGRPCHHP